jgi:hypothetical protein
MSSFAQQGLIEGPLSVFGPRNGYSTQIGFLVSQLNWMRAVVLSRLKNLSVGELDWLPHPDGNSIGALLMHLAAVDTYYGLNTFDGVAWGRFSYEARKKWSVAINLGETARVRYKGHDLQYYLSPLSETREHTLLELSKRDDEWLMAIDSSWNWGATNTFANGSLCANTKLTTWVRSIAY